MERDRVHIGLWRSLSQSHAHAHRTEAARLRSRITELEQELADRPEKEVVSYVGEDEIRGANEEAGRAFRSRERAWQALCEIRVLHRERDEGRCQCGLRIDRCQIAEIVARYPALLKWEAEQIRRLRSNDWRGHMLPDGHPAVLDRNWEA
jgi:hypothetical protein